MSGIAGIVAWNGVPVDTAALQRMNDLLAHRGPDGEAFVLGRGSWSALQHSFLRRAEERGEASLVRVGLAHRRLAILDLSERGLQPMPTPEGRHWIVFNGEIYNYRELRAALEGAGRAFTTRTDTEVLLQAYAEWGEACLDRLEGMWAFAIWDGAASTLFCARDRLGIKPFYYTQSDAQFAFASEIKAFTALPWFVAKPDDEAVVGFLTHANCDAGERTTFCGVRTLPAGHLLRLHAPSGTLTTRAYWKPPTSGSQHRAGDTDHVQEVRRSLVASIRKHLISDVRAGSCLSGGLDSSAVAGLIGHLQRDEPYSARAVGERLHTFTSCCEDEPSDESEFALAVARRIGAQAQLVFPSPDDFCCNFHRIAWQQDMPFGDLSCYAQWRVMRAAREAGVKVLLDGQGGQEVFGGSARLRHADSGPAARRWRAPRAAESPGATLVECVALDDVMTATLAPLLRAEDRASMAFSIEARMPLLDHTVVELGLALPDHLKVNGGLSEVALREAVAGIMPEQVRLRTPKPRFGAPNRVWLSRSLRPAITELLSGELRCVRYIDVPALRRWYRSAEAKTADMDSYLDFFRVLSLEMWMRAFKLT